MPYLTTYLFTDMPGVSAVYVSGAFAGALSTVSSNLSSMSNVFVNDFLYTWTSKKSEKFQIALRNEFQLSKITVKILNPEFLNPEKQNSCCCDWWNGNRIRISFKSSSEYYSRSCFINKVGFQII